MKELKLNDGTVYWIGMSDKQWEVVRLLESGLKPNEIMARLGCSYPCVLHWRKKLGLPHLKRGRKRGIRSGSSVRVTASAATARQMRSEGKKYREIAARLGISRQRAHQLVNRDMTMNKKSVDQMFTPRQLSLSGLRGIHQIHSWLLTSDEKWTHPPKILAKHLGINRSTLERSLDLMICAGAPIAFRYDCAPYYKNREFTSDEIERWLNNSLCSPNCFRPKYPNGRFFNERCVGQRGEARIQRLLVATRTKFPLDSIAAENLPNNL